MVAHAHLWCCHDEQVFKSHSIGREFSICSHMFPWYPLHVLSWGAGVLGACARAGCDHDWCHRISRPELLLVNVDWTFRFQKPMASFGHNMPQPSSICSGGVGKSSWVNAVRRVSSPNDPDFAELCVDGPTMEPQMYRFPAQTLGCDGPHPSTVFILNVTKWWKWMKMIYRIIYRYYIYIIYPNVSHVHRLSIVSLASPKLVQFDSIRGLSPGKLQHPSPVLSLFCKLLRISNAYACFSDIYMDWPFPDIPTIFRGWRESVARTRTPAPSWTVWTGATQARAESSCS